MPLEVDLKRDKEKLSCFEQDQLIGNNREMQRSRLILLACLGQEIDLMLRSFHRIEE